MAGRTPGVPAVIGQLLRPVRAGEKHLASNDPAIRAVPATLTLFQPRFPARRGHPRAIRRPRRGGKHLAGPELVRRPGRHPAAGLDRGGPRRPGPAAHRARPRRPASRPARAGRRRLSPGDTVRLGRNSLGHSAYDGPRPVPGHGPHTYVFQLFALGQPLTLGPSFTRRDLLAAMRGVVLARGRLDGTYER